MSNPTLVPLLAGVLIGWVTYFLLDLFFLRRPKPDPRILELEAAVQRCGDDLHTATIKRDSLQADLDVAVSARNRVEADLQARQQDLADCKSRTNQLAADLQARDQKLADLQTQLGSLQASLNAATSARANVEAELALRDQRLAEAQTQLGQLNWVRRHMNYSTLSVATCPQTLNPTASGYGQALIAHVVAAISSSCQAIWPTTGVCVSTHAASVQGC